MKTIKTHENLDLWKLAIEFVTKIYQLTKTFPPEEKYGLVSQIRRAAVSIPSNIAEGAARNHTQEMIQFMYIALGSISELETQLEISKRLGFMSKTSEVVPELQRLKMMTINLIRSLKTRIKAPA